MTPFQIISLIPGVALYIFLSYGAYLSLKNKADDVWIAFWLYVNIALAIILPLITLVK